MDMKETYRYTVAEADCDSRGYMSPAAIVLQATMAASLRNKDEGAGRPILRSKLGAAWMFRRIKLEQLLPIRQGDELVGYGSSRTNCETEYVIRGVLMRGDEEVAHMDIVWMPVVLKSRKKLSCADVEPLYSTQALNEVPDFPRLPIMEGLDYSREKIISEADCDVNASHFASHNYAGLVCREIGYFEGDYRRIAEMQIDYVKECVTGNTIRLAQVEKDGRYIVQGIHTSGKPCFNASVLFA